MPHTLVTIAATYGLALAAGTIAGALNNWFGSSDLIPFGMYSVPFSLLAALVEGVLFKATQRLPVWLASACAFIAGLVFGWLGTFAVALALGPWFGAMSVPMLPVWCSTAAFIFSAAIVMRRAPQSHETALSLIASLSILTALGFYPVVSFLNDDQHLTLYFFRHHPADTELQVRDPFANVNPRLDVFPRLDDEDLALLRQTGLRGTLERLNSSGISSTDLPHAKALIILTTPFVQDMSAPQPKRCSIAYVQENGGFRRIPDTAPTLERQILIERVSGRLEYWVELFSGAKSGGSIGT